MLHRSIQSAICWITSIDESNRFVNSTFYLLILIKNSNASRDLFGPHFHFFHSALNNRNCRCKISLSQLELIQSLSGKKKNQFILWLCCIIFFTSRTFTAHPRYTTMCSLFGPDYVEFFLHNLINLFKLKCSTISTHLASLNIQTWNRLITLNKWADCREYVGM